MDIVHTVERPFRYILVHLVPAVQEECKDTCAQDSYDNTHRHACLAATAQAVARAVATFICVGRRLGFAKRIRSALSLLENRPCVALVRHLRYLARHI